jgi:predicted ATPase
MINKKIKGGTKSMTRQEVEERLIKKAWADSEFKKQLLSDPKSAIEKEIGQSLPENFVVKALEETSNTAYIRIPRNPEELSDSEMDNVAGGCILSVDFSGW